MSMLLTAAAVLGLAMVCQHSFPPAMILAIAEGESRLPSGLFNTAAVNLNRNGTRDYGLMQINSGNLAWLGLTQAAAMDPCVNIAAAEAVLKTFSRYNSGNPTASPAYAKAAYLRMRSTAIAAQPTVPDPSPDKPEQDVSFEDRPANAGGETFFAE